MYFFICKYKVWSLFGLTIAKPLCVYRHLSTVTSPLFGWNSKIVMYFKQRDVSNACKLFDEMPYKNVVTWNCMVSGFVRNGMICEAREVFDSMPNRNVVSWTAMLNGYAKNGRLNEARSLFDAVENKNVICWNSMISGYVTNGRLEEARSLFDVMPVKNEVTWTAMIEGYFKYGAASEAERLFDEALNKSVSLCNAMLAGYSELGHVDQSYDLFIRMKKRDVASWTSMITCFLRVGEVERARKLFEEMPEKDVVVWTAMIRGYLDNDLLEEAQELFSSMPTRDIVAWNSMIVGYIQKGKLGDALDLFMKMPCPDIVSWNSILWGYIQKDDMISARRFFEKMPIKDVASWNTMISAYSSEESLHLYRQVLQGGFKPDQVTFASVISACGILAMQACGRALHASVVKYGYENGSMLMSSFISMYSKCGAINDAFSIFKMMRNRDTAAWNSMILAHVYNSSAKEAVNLFQSMIQSGCEPDNVTFLVLLTGCAHHGLVNEGWNYFKSMEEWNMKPKAEHYACMVDLLGRSGFLAEAFEFVEELPDDLPAYAWETLLGACRVHGNSEIGNFVAQKITSLRSYATGMLVLKSNIYAARGMWTDSAHVRSAPKKHQVKKELGCSWIEINGQVSCFSCHDKSHSQTEEIYKELESLAILIDEAG